MDTVYPFYVEINWLRFIVFFYEGRRRDWHLYFSVPQFKIRFNQRDWVISNFRSYDCVWDEIPF